MKASTPTQPSSPLLSSSYRTTTKAKTSTKTKSTTTKKLTGTKTTSTKTKTAAKPTIVSSTEFGGSASDFPSLSGYLFIDADHNGVMGAGDWAVGNVVVTLLKAGDPSFSMSYTTGMTGFYHFGDLQPGLYTVETPVLPQIFQSGQSEIGGFVNSGGTYYPYPGGAASIVPYAAPTLVGSDYGTAETSGGRYLVSDINIQDGLAGVDYNFLESALQPNQVSKRLFLASTAGGTTMPDGTVAGPTYWVNGGTTVPEPCTLSLLGAGGITGGLAVWRRRSGKKRRRKHQPETG